MKNVFTNEFHVSYNEDEESLFITTIDKGTLSKFPIRLRLNELKKMGPAKASEWVGQTLMLLIPSVREKLYEIRED